MNKLYTKMLKIVAYDLFIFLGWLTAIFLILVGFFGLAKGMCSYMEGCNWETADSGSMVLMLLLLFWVIGAIVVALYYRVKEVRDQAKRELENEKHKNTKSPEA